MATDTKLNTLVLNVMTKEQYENIDKDNNELYLITDDETSSGGDYVDLTSTQYSIKGVKYFNDGIVAGTSSASENSIHIYNEKIVWQRRNKTYDITFPAQSGTIALTEDIPTYIKHYVILNMIIDSTANFQLRFSCYTYNTGEITTIDEIATLTGMATQEGEVWENGILVPTTDTSIYQIVSFYLNKVSMEMKIVYTKPMESPIGYDTATIDLNTQLTSYKMTDRVIVLS